MEEPNPSRKPPLAPPTGDQNSPEFEFWMVRNPSFPQPNLLSADELFSDGFLLPLHLLPQNAHSDPLPANPIAEVDSGSGITAASVSDSISTSKRWTDIFRKSEKKSSEGKDQRKTNQIGSGASPELNINIWPFSRSRSAGNARARMRSAGPGTKKASSAPCSRSNSAGESKSRKWTNSPGRAGGIHLGRSSPVWQFRRGDSGVKESEPVTRERNKGSGGGGGAKGRVLNVNVPVCIGYRHNLSCRSDANNDVGGSGDGGRSSSGGGGGGNGGSNLFNLRNLFTKKVS